MIKQGIETFGIKIIVKINTNTESNTQGVNIIIIMKKKHIY